MTVEQRREYRPATLREVAESQGGPYKEFLEIGPWSAPVGYFGNEGIEIKTASYWRPALATALLADCSLLQGRSPIVKNSIVFAGRSHNGYFEERACFPEGRATDALLSTLSSQVGPRLPGLHAIVGGHHNNFWHFCYNNFLSLFAIEHFLKQDTQRMRIVVPEDTKNSFLQMFGYAGYDADKIQKIPASPVARFESAVFSEAPFYHDEGNHRIAAAPEPLELVRRRLPMPGPERRIYLSRADARWRMLTNEEEVWGLLRARGFTRVLLSQISVAELAPLMAGANVVVGPTGANLAATIFCFPGTRVIELSYSTMLGKYFFQGSSAAGGLPHYKIAGVPREDPDRRHHAWDFSVPPSAISIALDLLL
jgi:hypothetical protein